MITIIEYGMGNLGSINNMLKKIGIKSEITSNLDQIYKARKIILPGVGAFDKAMEKINASELRKILDDKAMTEKVPILGICLGMQLLTNQSEEGTIPGLGWIKSNTIRFPKNKSIKIPHMGWNRVFKNTDSLLTSTLPEGSRYYFVHSYYVQVKNEKNSILKSEYSLKFDSGIQNDNIFGVQFHPEKSHKFGMNLLKNFAKL